VKSYSRSHLTDRDILQLEATHFSQIQTNMADHLADIAEIDARGLFRLTGHSSLVRFLQEERDLSEDAAFKRIQAARKALEFPGIFQALGEGRLYLTSVNMLAPHLTRSNADELLAAASGKPKSQIALMLAERFPRTEELPLIETLPIDSTPLPEADVASNGQLAPAQVEPPRSRVDPVARGRFSLHLTMNQRMHDKLQQAADLLGHQIPDGDPAKVLERALDALIPKLEKRKFGTADNPRQRRGISRGRQIPAAVRRAVTERDGKRCTFMLANGLPCGSRRMLEFDHVIPVARGGQSTVENLRLRCRAHNQYEAEQVYGRDFMDEKREEARKAAARREQIEDVVSGLRNLGVPAARARRAAESSAPGADATIEQRMRAALRWLVPKRTPPEATLAAT
jgi:hypothetical protein